MVKNKLESKFSESMHADKELWGMKLISNPLTHQNTPADYIIDYKDSTMSGHPDHTNLRLMLVECKQVSCDEDGSGRFAFKRLKQMHDLINFENVRPYNHKSFVCIAFWDKRWDKSDVYLIPIHQFERFIMLLNKESGNRKDFFTHMMTYKIANHCGVFDLSGLKK